MEKGFITIKILEQVGKAIKLPIEKAIEPQEFFQTGNNLYVYDDFKSCILKNAKRSYEKSYSLESFDLERRSSDEEIEEVLGKDHLFSETDVCAIVAELISKQSKGQKGTLQHNGYANLFYTKSFVVAVRWRGSHWGVYAWDRDEDGWYSGGRVFSPAN